MDPKLDVTRFRGKKSKITILKTNPYADYTDKGSIGGGAYGSVKKVRKGKRYVAIKSFFVEDIKTRKEVWNDFQQELCCFEFSGGASYGHENVVKFLNAFQTPDAYCIALEYCKEGDLSRIYKNYKKYTEADIREIIIQCCKGLKYLLDNLIVHRDIKDGNILVKQWKPIKVCIADLNLSKKLKTLDHKTSMHTTQVGSEYYEAPEISNKRFRSKTGCYNHKVDIYSLGKIAYELFTFEEEMPVLRIPREYKLKMWREGHALSKYSNSQYEIERKYYESLNETGAPLEPAFKFKKMSTEARHVVSRMLLPLYKTRIDYDEIIESDWSTKEYPTKLPSIRSILLKAIRAENE